MESPQSVKINRILDEASNIKTLLFNHKFQRTFTPGQFVMVWLPGVDEIPLALSYYSIDGTHEHGVTIVNVGEATEKLHSMGKNDWIGVRGPYGSGFNLGKAKHVLVVGGGIGMAPLGLIVEKAVMANHRVDIAIGAKTASDLLFVDRIHYTGINPIICTDDGSEGKKALVTELAEEMLSRNKIELVLGCGPEVMLAKLVKICSEAEIPVQVSLERYMKCGLGICDSCAINGFHVCTDGPVFTGEQLEHIEDFGKFRRDASGLKIKF